MLALAAAAPALLLVARLLPADGVGLAVRLFAATVCVLVLPGALILRAFAWPDSPSLALTAAVVLSLAVAFVAFLLTFATAGTLTLALVLMGIAALVALVPAALARVGPDEPGERLAFAVLVVAALAYGGVVWWVSHSLGTGDVLFHLARARKIADGETLESLRVVGEFRDGGLHPGYAFPLWHGVVAMIARLAGVDVSLVVLHGAAVLVPFAFAAAYAAGRALFGSWVGGVAVLAAQVAQIGFTHAGTGSFPSIAPGSVTRVVLVPALLALLFAYLREREWRLLVPLGAASLAVVVIHSSYIVLVAVPIAGFALLLVALWNPRREAAIGLAVSLGVDLRRRRAVPRLAAADRCVHRVVPAGSQGEAARDRPLRRAAPGERRHLPGGPVGDHLRGARRRRRAHPASRSRRSARAAAGVRTPSAGCSPASRSCSSRSSSPSCPTSCRSRSRAGSRSSCRCRS